jgi:hypothetical protein
MLSLSHPQLKIYIFFMSLFLGERTVDMPVCPLPMLLGSFHAPNSAVAIKG